MSKPTNTRRPILALSILATLFAAIWFLLLDDNLALPNNPAAIDSDITSEKAISVPKPSPAALIKPDSYHQAIASEAADKPAPAKDADFEPDYGQLLQRGGGVVSFELYDANNKRVELGKDPITLRRIFGDKAIIDGCHYKDNRIVCEGLSHYNTYTGLEPGEYELTFESAKWGNMRQRFHVARGEQRNERLQSKHYERVVCFYFVDQYGQPVKWLPEFPVIISGSTPLPEITYNTPESHFLKSRPDRRTSTSSNSWVSLGSNHRRFTERDTWCETDEGRFYVTVWAGASSLSG